MATNFDLNPYFELYQLLNTGNRENALKKCAELLQQFHFDIEETLWGLSIQNIELKNPSRTPFKLLTSPKEVEEALKSQEALAPNSIGLYEARIRDDGQGVDGIGRPNVNTTISAGLIASAKAHIGVHKSGEVIKGYRLNTDVGYAANALLILADTYIQQNKDVKLEIKWLQLLLNIYFGLTSIQKQGLSTEHDETHAVAYRGFTSEASESTAQLIYRQVLKTGKIDKSLSNLKDVLDQIENRVELKDIYSLIHTLKANISLILNADDPEQRNSINAKHEKLMHCIKELLPELRASLAANLGKNSSIDEVVAKLSQIASDLSTLLQAINYHKIYYYFSGKTFSIESEKLWPKLASDRSKVDDPNLTPQAQLEIEAAKQLQKYDISFKLQSINFEFRVSDLEIKQLAEPPQYLEERTLGGERDTDMIGKANQFMQDLLTANPNCQLEKFLAFQEATVETSNKLDVELIKLRTTAYTLSRIDLDIGGRHPETKYGEIDFAHFYSAFDSALKAVKKPSKEQQSMSFWMDMVAQLETIRKMENTAATAELEYIESFQRSVEFYEQELVQAKEKALSSISYIPKDTIKYNYNILQSGWARIEQICTNRLRPANIAKAAAKATAEIKAWLDLENLSQVIDSLSNNLINALKIDQVRLDSKGFTDAVKIAAELKGNLVCLQYDVLNPRIENPDKNVHINCSSSIHEKVKTQYSCIAAQLPKLKKLEQGLETKLDADIKANFGLIKPKFKSYGFLRLYRYIMDTRKYKRDFKQGKELALQPLKILDQLQAQLEQAKEVLEASAKRYIQQNFTSSTDDAMAMVGSYSKINNAMGPKPWQNKPIKPQPVAQKTAWKKFWDDGEVNIVGIGLTIYARLFPPKPVAISPELGGSTDKVPVTPTPLSP
jgi:hypothetical protein